VSMGIASLHPSYRATNQENWSIGIEEWWVSGASLVGLNGIGSSNSLAHEVGEGRGEGE
jgi:hypothetical protein